MLQWAEIDKAIQVDLKNILSSELIIVSEITPTRELV
jgi:hypothetical protein